MEIEKRLKNMGEKVGEKKRVYYADGSWEEVTILSRKEDYDFGREMWYIEYTVLSPKGEKYRVDEYWSWEFFW
jgi:hypothetical protein